jgi:hypothetical protein
LSKLELVTVESDKDNQFGTGSDLQVNWKATEIGLHIASIRGTTLQAGRLVV